MAVRRYGSVSVCSVASISSPFNAENGMIYASLVHGLRGQKKRRRHEIVLGIDGEAINIYNFQTQNLVTSIPIPSHYRLSCSPCSVYLRQAHATSTSRQTFIALKGDATGSKCRLVCYSEILEKSKSVDERFQTVKRELQLSEEAVISIDVLPAETAGEYNRVGGIIVSYSNGRVDCISADMAGLVWTWGATHTKNVEYSEMFDGHAAARQGIFAARGEFMAALDLDTSESGQTRVAYTLCQISVMDRGRVLEVFCFRNSSSDDSRTKPQELHTIMEYRLPPLAPDRHEATVYDLDMSSGKLYQLDSGQLTILDLSEITPRVLSQLGDSNSPISSFARLPSNLVLAIVRDKAVVYESRYGSIQDSVEISWESNNMGPRHNRGTAPREPFRAICGFAESNLVLGLAGEGLVAVQSAKSRRESTRTHGESILLSRVVERGVAEEGLDFAHDKLRRRRFKQWKGALEAAIAGSDCVALEKMTAEVLRLKLPTGRNGNAKASTCLGERHTEMTAQAFDISSINIWQALYILAKCFRTENSGRPVADAELVPASASSDVYKWLALTGFMRPLYINRALHYIETPGLRVPRVVPGDLMKIFSRFDSNLELMYEMLATPIYWDVEEIVQALKILAKSFEVEEEIRFSDGGARLDSERVEDIHMVNGDMDSKIESESRVAEHEVLHAQATLGRGLEIRSAALRLTLARLYAFPAKEVSHAVRARLGHHELLFFLHVLRIELAGGGWTTRYQDAAYDSLGFVLHDDAERQTRPSDQAIKVIADLLNCTIDAIGKGAWLTGLRVGLVATQEMVSDLRAEASAALECSLEAAAVHQMLNELERSGALASLVAVEETANRNVEQAGVSVGGNLHAPLVNGCEPERTSRKRHLAIGPGRLLRVNESLFKRIRV